MAKKTKKEPTDGQALVHLRELATNAALLRTELLSELLDDRRDIDEECGYPKNITVSQYRYMYDREGVARRVVQVWPEDTWSVDPEVQENDEADQTPFEEAWADLQERRNVHHYLHRVDELSGIGRFGVLFLGFDDGKEMHEPVEPAEGRQLLYIRAFDEKVVTVDKRETNPANPRFGQPTEYTITFTDLENSTGGSAVGGIPADQEGEPRSVSGGIQIRKRVHWTRVIHVADNRETSEIFGTPRMQPVYNRLFDIRKVLSGSGEMYWKGAFPGYSLETNPDVTDAEIDADDLRDEMANWANGLQRWLALTGVSVKSIAPQVTDPNPQVKAYIENIAITLGIPKRKLMGSEQAQLASEQDSRSWNKKIAKRQKRYAGPMIVRPFVDRCIDVGVLPEPSEGREGYVVTWPDLEAQSDEEKADVAAKWAKALALYVQHGLDAVVPPAEFLRTFLGFEQETVEAIMAALAEYLSELDVEEGEPGEPGGDGPDGDGPDGDGPDGDGPDGDGGGAE